MKTANTFKRITLVALLGAVLAIPVMAQQAAGTDDGTVVQNGAVGAGMGMGAGQGMGQGMGQGGGMGGRNGMGKMGGRGMRFNQNNTPGWTLMTAEERTAHQTKMRSLTTYAECKQVQAEHRVTMEARANEKGVTLQTGRQNGCDRMQARGFFK